jgi:peptidoglycan hydrolase CwlO-like protein
MKQYITHFHKEQHKAEEELQEVEDKVEQELGVMFKQSKQTQSKVQETQKDIKATNKKVEKIENIIQEEITQKKPRWKIRTKK